MPSILDDPGKIIIMAGDFPTKKKKQEQAYETNTHTRKTTKFKTMNILNLLQLIWVDIFDAWSLSIPFIFFVLTNLFSFELKLSILPETLSHEIIFVPILFFFMFSFELIKKFLYRNRNYLNNKIKQYTPIL